MDMLAKKILLPIVFLASGIALAACGSSAEKLNNQGNEAFYNQDFEGALTAYRNAQAESPELAEPHYNAANTHYRREAYQQAQHEIEQTLIKDEGDLAQDSFYNLGNTFFQGEQYEQAIEAYKEALRLNPDDAEAKQNLELALRQLQQQEQQQQEQQQDQDQQQDHEQQQSDQGQNDDQQQQQDGQEGDQQQDQEEQEGDQEQESQQQDGQQNDQPQDDQQQDNQQGEGQGQPQKGQPGDQEQQGQPNGQPQIVHGLTKDQARQLLEAAAEGTESLEEHLQLILVAPGAPPAEDW
jgi:tetratricopeptide (TPR) repeat protein